MEGLVEHLAPGLPAAVQVGQVGAHLRRKVFRGDPACQPDRLADLGQVLGAVLAAREVALEPGQYGLRATKGGQSFGGRITLAQGARVQSSPAPGDSSPPVKIETLSDVQLVPSLSAVRLLAPPQSASPLASGSSGGALQPGSVLPAGNARK